MAKDYYSILGVSRDASEDDLKKAFRKLSMQYHPDRQTGKSDDEKKAVEEKFKEINEAYSVLKDKDKRANYDRFGSADGFSGGGGFDPGSFFRGGGSPFDMFERMFSGRGGFGPRARHDDSNAPEQGEDVTVRINVSFKESLFGCTKDFSAELDKQCPECDGTGAKKGTSRHTCSRCGGSGQISETRSNGFMTTHYVSPCPDCHGEGETFEKCPCCHGTKRVPDTKNVKIKIPAGIANGQRLRVKNMGRCGLRGGSNGTMYVMVGVGASELFERDGDTLVTTVCVSPVTAALGGTVDVPTPYGWKKMQVDAGVKSDTVVPMRGAGIRFDNGRTGDLLVRLVVETPSDLTNEQKDCLERFRKLETDANFKNMREIKAHARKFYET